MKFSLALPLLIVPALASPLGLPAIDKKDLATMTHLYKKVVPMDAQIEHEIEKIKASGSAPSAAQLSSLNSGMAGVVKEIVEAIGLLTTPLAGFPKRELTNEQKELKEEMTKTVTEISTMLASIQNAGPEFSIPLSASSDKTALEMTKMGLPLEGAGLAGAGELINKIILKIAGSGLLPA